MTDPFDYHVPGSSQTVEFYGYRNTLPEIEALGCFKLALSDAILEHDATTLMGTKPISYFSPHHNVYLNLIPRETMTWGMWTSALHVMVSFTLDEVDKEYQFMVLEHRIEDEVGYGSLTFEAPM